MGPNSCPTIQIQGQPSDGNPSGIVVINESDFDAATMVKVETSTNAVVEKPVEAAVVETKPVASGKAAKAVAPWAA